MDADEFKRWGYEIVDWIADYFNNIEKYDVKPNIEPGYVINQLPQTPPENSEKFENIIDDFKKIIVPGMTHWQHPKFFGYFPANTSFPSIAAEFLTSALAAQCMMWQTSPAAAELEELTMDWLRQMIGLPNDFTGVIQDTASTATLCSILTAREKYSSFDINAKGFSGDEQFRVYCSSEAHSSIEKAVKIAGIGKENLVKIPVDENFAMLPDELEKVLEVDTINGYKPLCVVSALGTTGSTAIDPLKEIGVICKENNIWLHVDAAFAGSALILPEYRHLLDGIEYADTFVFNPHKWLFTNFDCSAYFVRDKEALVRTFQMIPEYLKSAEAHVNNYKDWGIQLGRRFRALKLWFVIRSFGVSGLQEKLRLHIKLAQDLVKNIESENDFEILAPVPFNTICFRYKPAGVVHEEEINKINEKLLSKLNETGKLFLTHTKLNEKYVIRFMIGQTNVNEKHVSETWELIKSESRNLLNKN
ncbi:MAG: amino acid decarboxylase [Ignavibacteria bacterium GWB2_35_12]|nr:MAG: amino acid decarboxylase [Ignavibacteria bacterium GWA2_35_8]OGU41983.1 MAG: amino acid decarboxylase [Ignavibacteria bacterium GWB2_35_12]OGU88212.1 MAG: amino acid decarboxylase [Ignavibacteria bacterium RIFOXYA2_FULL_35_10]OGV24423.1 MAG: amino acid decarboxylase [Ignavibacteria bacterium RIFOXYC2_FULL_35_21]